MIPFYINLYTCNEKFLLNLKYSYFHVYVFFSLQLKTKLIKIFHQKIRFVILLVLQYNPVHPGLHLKHVPFSM